MQQHFSVKMWAEEDRPREKMALKGRKHLSNAELIAILLGSGSRDKSALELAKEILRDQKNDLSLLSNLTLEELKRYRGIGDAKAIALLSAFELGWRRLNAERPKIVKIESSSDAHEVLRPHFDELSIEKFYVIYLNRANIVISTECISSGGISGTFVDGKIIFNRAIQLLASGIVLAHNHPSGTLKPSLSDEKLTRNLVEFGKLVDIQIIDHLIISENGYFSFTNNQML